MSYQSLLPLLQKTGSSLSPEKFQERINIVFHDFEAGHYDAMHTDMWGSLQEQINLLIADLFSHHKPQSNELSLLDIGCGTGLSSQILLNSQLGQHINKVTLLDTSPNMLKYAEQKAKTWGKEYKTRNGYLADVNEKFDVIIISSVLHHIPDLEAFLNQVDNALNQGGILIHIQDPNGDYINTTEYLQRKEEYEKVIDALPKNKKITDFIPKPLLKSIKRMLNRKDYIDLINDQLLAEKTIKRRMTANEIWTVTDIHVETKTDSVNKGISLEFLKKQLTGFELLQMRSYGFYGFLKSDLIDSYKEKEAQFIAENNVNGRNISCIWMKK
ncbi:class I SAM-dependent methyltransferase [Flavobacterium terrisoli]|uniref:class I SAM-dependent methyltransferase n=1 Tax=Flavobacterium terrisoli TaxID=3242195 RepID=UPI0025427CE1|nr:class I SAM-dependent methyltransferase [Flavobacterium buctense]